jgi:YceI-like domain.
MRKLILILTLCLTELAGFSLNDGLKSGKTNSSSGFIDITVLSNIDKQFFQYNLNQQCLSIAKEPETGYMTGVSASRIKIPVEEFKCTNKFAYKDFLTLLKAEKHPYLEIEIPASPGIKYITVDSLILKGVTVTVAGVSNHYDINCKIVKGNNENQILDGSTRIKLTDLDIAPPVKLFGLVKVKNEITINFEFCLKSI